MLFLSFFLELFYMAVGIMGGMRGLRHLTLTSAAEASLLLLPCLCLRGKWKYAATALPPLLALIVLVNLLYFRYFSDLIPGVMYLAPGVVNGATVSGGVTVLRWADVFLLIVAVMPMVYALRLPRGVFKAIAPTWPVVVADVVVLIGSWAAVWRSVFVAESQYYSDLTPLGVVEVVLDSDHMNWLYPYRRFGLTGYTAKCLMNLNGRYVSLTADERRELLGHLRFRSQDAGEPAEAASLKKPQNLVFIVVESLPSRALSITDSRYAAPFLTGLLSDSAAVSVSLEVLAGPGNSSDAQFVYNTGLLPLRNEALVVSYAVNDYPALAKAAGGEAVEVIGETASMWNHSLTTKSYGYDRLVDMVAPGGLDRDSLIFREALRQLDSLKQPFLLFMSTISMHAAYRSPAVSYGLDTSRLSVTDSRDKEYLQRLNHFDRQLKAFIDSLRARGLYDDTLIVIAGDHAIPPMEVSEELRDDHVPLFLLNSPLRNPSAGPFTQADVFPTVLDAMGLSCRWLGADYRGLGTSIFAPGPHPLAEEDWRVSEWIIRSAPGSLR